MIKKGLSYIGDKQAIIFRNNIIIDNKKIEGTPGLWELIKSKNPINYTNDDYDNYTILMLKTNALHRYNNSNNPYPKSSKGQKWKRILNNIWKNREEYGERISLLFRVTLMHC